MGLDLKIEHSRDKTYEAILRSLIEEEIKLRSVKIIKGMTAGQVRPLVSFKDGNVIMDVSFVGLIPGKLPYSRLKGREKYYAEKICKAVSIQLPSLMESAGEVSFK